MEHAVLIDSALGYYPYWYRNSRTGHSEPTTLFSTLLKDTAGGCGAYETRKIQPHSWTHLRSLPSFLPSFDKQLLIQLFVGLEMPERAK
jgi:hypothetical protein